MDNLFRFVIFSSAFTFFIVINGVEVGASQDECVVSKCRDHGPAIRFPFWLKNRQPDHCGYPGFSLSCTAQNDTLLELPLSVNLYVKRIDYKSQVIHVYDPDGCLPKHLPNLNLSASPFQYKLNHRHDASPFQYKLNHRHDYLANYTLFSCSSADRYIERFLIPCLSTPGNQVYAFYSLYSVSSLPLSSCSKISSIWPPIPYGVLHPPFHLGLNWSEPKSCMDCEAVGMRCRRKNSTATETECFKTSHGGTSASTKLAIAGGILGLFLLVLAVFGVYRVHTADKVEKENQVKIKKFLEDYEALKPTRYSYADIKRITNQFKDKVGQGGYGTVFKGNLSNEILVAVKILNDSTGNGEEFINEVGTMGRIHHVNVVRLVGYCADGFRRALIYEFLPNESLEKFIFSADIKNHSLGWEKLQDIALGIAKGIEYLHQGCDQRILHFDIKPHNILLDHNFNPKISDFGLAKLCSKEKSVVSMTAARGTMGYIAPEVFSRNFGNVSYKSDVYSFGMLLLEMVGGRKNVDVKVQNTSQVYFPEWIYNRLDQGEELEIRIEEEGDAKIGKKLTIVGLWCIQWYPVDRPSMRVVVQMLEGEGDGLTMPPNPFATTNPMKTTATMPGRPFNRELEVISESE